MPEKKEEAVTNYYDYRRNEHGFSIQEEKFEQEGSDKLKSSNLHGSESSGYVPKDVPQHVITGMTETAVQGSRSVMPYTAVGEDTRRIVGCSDYRNSYSESIERHHNHYLPSYGQQPTPVLSYSDHRSDVDYLSLIHI